jgi:HPt (histidine-containing phosphotransfer) domain-containing protein
MTDAEPEILSNRLIEITDGDMEFALELAIAFRDTSKKTIVDLEKALKDKDEKNSILWSHDLKGSSASVGAERCRKIAAEMEALSKDKKYEEILELLPKLKETLEETYTALMKAAGKDSS